jgi:uncharacterized protein
MSPLNMEQSPRPLPGYRPRVVDGELSSRLRASGAVVIEGPRACGKTETARRLAASEVLLDIDDNARQTAAVAAELVLEGQVPRLIDEWQIEPRLWNHVRRTIDTRKQPGQFILTGSAVPPDDVSRHTGAGRIARLRMRPMSMFESGRSSGTISLRALFNGEPAQSPDTCLTVSDLAEEIARGGWPGYQDLPLADALRGMRDYLDAIGRGDISRVDGVARDPDRVVRLFRSLARNVATHAAATTLAKDTGGTDGPLKDDTVREYLTALHRLMIVEDQPAWTPHLRSKYVLRRAPKRHFVDPSLAAAALRAGPELLLRDMNLLGLLFESLVVRDLRVYAQASEAQVLQYRDSNDLEADCVVQCADGRWAAFEVKLGSAMVDEGAATLARFASQIDTLKSGAPAMLGVIVGTGYGYMRDDGIAVIPIGALGP